MDDIKKLTKQVIKFSAERNWRQYHSPKDMAMGLICEAAEVVEHFKYHNEKDMQKYVKKHKEEIADELSDVLHWILLMSYDLKIDIVKSFEKKMKKNTKKYPLKTNH